MTGVSGINEWSKHSVCDPLIEWGIGEEKKTFWGNEGGSMTFDSFLVRYSLECVCVGGGGEVGF